MCTAALASSDLPRRRSKKELSAPRAELLLWMQHINFGRIENLRISNGDPIVDPPPRVIREVKFGGENGPRPEAGNDDFVLKDKVVEMLGNFDRLRNGTIEVLEIKHGLPFRMMILESGH